MEGGLHPVGSEAIQQAVPEQAIRAQQVEDVMRRVAVGELLGEPDSMGDGPVAETFPVAARHPLAAFLNRVEAVELSVEQRRQHVGQDEARARRHPAVLLYLAALELAAIGPLLPYDLGTLRHLTIPNRKSTTFAAGDVLRLVEAQRARITQAAQRPAPKRAAEALGGVLDELHLPISREGTQPIHVGGDPRVVNGHQHPGAIGQARGHVRGVEPQRSGLDVGEHGACPDAQSRVGRGDEGEARHDHFVAGADSQRQQSQLESVAARGRQKHALDLQHRGEPLLDPLAEGSIPGDPATQGLLNSLELSLLEPRLGERDVVRRSGSLAPQTRGTSAHASTPGMGPGSVVFVAGLREAQLDTQFHCR